MGATGLFPLPCLQFHSSRKYFQADLCSDGARTHQMRIYGNNAFMYHYHPAGPEYLFLHVFCQVGGEQCENPSQLWGGAFIAPKLGEGESRPQSISLHAAKTDYRAIIPKCLSPYLPASIPAKAADWTEALTALKELNRGAREKRMELALEREIGAVLGAGSEALDLFMPDLKPGTTPRGDSDWGMLRRREPLSHHGSKWVQILQWTPF